MIGPAKSIPVTENGRMNCTLCLSKGAIRGAWELGLQDTRTLDAMQNY